MRTLHYRTALASFLALLAGLVLALPALALEDGLMGIRIGASYRELTRRLGQPSGILLGSGGGMMYQTLVSRPAAGLPPLAAQPATTTEFPVWVLPVRVGSLAAGQAQWFYDLRASKGVALGIVLAGEGADAAVTDVVVAGFEKYLRGKPAPVRTERGITLLSSFADVLSKYGYPPLAEIYPAGAAGAGAAAGGAAGARGGAMRAGAATAAGMRGGGMRMGGGMRGGMGGGMRAGMGARRGGGMRGGAMGRGRAEADRPTVTAAAPAAGYQVELTGMMGGGRGMRGGGGMRGGMGAGMRGGTRGGGGTMRGGMRGGARGGARAGALPPLGTQVAITPAGAQAVTAFADNASIAFSRDCILTYEGIAFTIQDMKVMRIHVSE